jgi:hypothetical protein
MPYSTALVSTFGRCLPGVAPCVQHACGSHAGRRCVISAVALCIQTVARTSPLITARGSFLRAGPAHQFDRYYKDAQLDDCQRQINELKFCIKLKTAGPEETRVSWAHDAAA